MCFLCFTWFFLLVPVLPERCKCNKMKILSFRIKVLRFCVLSDFLIFGTSAGAIWAIFWGLLTSPGFSRASVGDKMPSESFKNTCVFVLWIAKDARRGQRGVQGTTRHQKSGRLEDPESGQSEPVRNTFIKCLPRKVCGNVYALVVLLCYAAV